MWRENRPDSEGLKSTKVHSYIDTRTTTGEGRMHIRHIATVTTAGHRGREAGNDKAPLGLRRLI
jgi:hypothetical protein